MSSILGVKLLFMGCVLSPLLHMEYLHVLEALVNINTSTFININHVCNSNQVKF